MLSDEFTAAVAVKRHLREILSHTLQQILLMVEASIRQDAAEHESSKLVGNEVVVFGQDAAD